MAQRGTPSLDSSHVVDGHFLVMSRVSLLSSVHAGTAALTRGQVTSRL